MENDERTLLTQFLSGREVRCPRCGYNLRDATSAACPECGDDLRLQVALVEPRLAAFVTTLVTISAGLGGSALFSLLALFQAPSGWWREPVARMLLGQLGLTMMALPAVLLWRRRLRRASRAVQWVVAVLSVTVVLAFWIVIVVIFDD